MIPEPVSALAGAGSFLYEDRMNRRLLRKGSAAALLLMGALLLTGCRTITAPAAATLVAESLPGAEAEAESQRAEGAAWDPEAGSRGTEGAASGTEAEGQTTEGTAPGTEAEGPEAGHQATEGTALGTEAEGQEAESLGTEGATPGTETEGLEAGHQGTEGAALKAGIRKPIDRGRMSARENRDGEEAPWLRDRPVVRGIYVTGPRAGSAAMEELIALVDGTELNTMVIDVKNDEGNITYQMELPAVQETGACIRYIPDMEGLMRTLKEHGIYTIARIVCFKDPYLAKGQPELALYNPDGTLFTDAYGLAWVNPYKEGVWEYLTQVSEAAIDIGFDEIQFDYVRFPIGSEADAADYGVDMEEYPKEKAIADFLEYASRRIHAKGALITADVFGTIIGSETDVKRVGQDYVALGGTLDVLSPMVYPSHYENQVFGLQVPDAQPYETVYAALTQSAEELSALPEGERARVRPWLQAFTATWVKGHIPYGGKEIRSQIQAVYDAGYEEWILWNASNRYSADGLEAAP